MTEILPIPLGFDTCYVLRDAGTVAIDAGMPRRGRAFVRGLAAAGVDPSEVALILLTHAHWDHMGSAAELKEITGAPLAVHEAEAGWVESGDPPLPPGVTPWGRTFMAVHRLVMPLIRVPPARVDRRLGDAGGSLRDLGIPADIVHTPGHSPGSVSVVLDDGRALVGDLAMNRLPLTARPSLPIFADEPDRILDSWERVLSRDPTTIHPAHGGPFPADIARRWLDGG